MRSRPSAYRFAFRYVSRAVSFRFAFRPVPRVVERGDVVSAGVIGLLSLSVRCGIHRRLECAACLDDVGDVDVMRR